jgi:hypothetical protein
MLKNQIIIKFAKKRFLYFFSFTKILFFGEKKCNLGGGGGGGLKKLKKKKK